MSSPWHAAAILQRFGIRPDALNGKADDLTPDRVIRLALELHRRDDVKNFPAMLARRIADGDEPGRLNLDDVYRGVQRGWIQSIDGQPVSKDIRRTPPSNPREIREGSRVILKAAQIEGVSFG